MPNIIRQSHLLRQDRRQADGVALVVTLTMLAIVAVLAVAFVLTARTEVKSGTAYNDQAAAKSLAKMAIDRAMMEIVREGKGEVISGGETSGGQPSSPSNSYIYVYSTNDFTRVDNWTNDLYLMNNVMTTTIPYGSAPGFDFVELDNQLGRSMIEPYWIGVYATNTIKNTGTLVGRFAYVGTGGLVDLNAIGNIASSKKSGLFKYYTRPADTNYGYGYLGKPKTNATPYYSRGICSDISLQKFLLKLGYNKDTVNTSAFCILDYRYAWGGGSFPGSQKRPGQDGVDNNNDGIANNPSEYAVYPNLVSDDNALTALSQIWTKPAIDGAIGWTEDLIGGANIFGTPDPAYTNLHDYASVGPSADPNIVSPAVGQRVNLNVMTNGNAANSSSLSNSVMQLTNVLWNFPQFTNDYTHNLADVTNKLIKIALNLIDFHTTNRYPSVFTNGVGASATVLTGIKPTPYINQVYIRYDTIFYRSTNSVAAANRTNYWFRTWVSVTNEIWNTYPGTFPDTNNLVITNVSLITTNLAVPTRPLTNAWTVSCLFTSPVPGYTITGVQNTNFYTTKLGFSNLVSVGYYSNWNQSWTPPGTLFITNIFVGATLYGTNSISASNLIQKISSAITNSVTNAWPTGNWNAGSWTNLNGTTNWTEVQSVILNLEADDPRMSLLYTQQNNTAGNYNLGAMNATCFPNSVNIYVDNGPNYYLDTGPREGTNSFYFKPTNTFPNVSAVVSNYYTSIGDIGYIHRGEPWATIRLWPYQSLASPTTFYPYGDGGLLDYFRVSDLLDVAGRININVSLNGPDFDSTHGINQSPALHALFSGITNPAYNSSPFPANSIDGIGDGTSDSKITAIIQELGAYRASLTNQVVGGTLAAINGTNGAFTLIGQICAITNLTTDLSYSPISYTNDANREALIRAVANLITTWQGGGTSQILGWGQVVKGGDTTKSNGVPGQVVKIMATFQNVGGKIRITSYQYIP